MYLFFLHISGSFEVHVKDPAYPKQHLFHCDFAVLCPNTFSIYFTIPTEGPDSYDKTLVAEITDFYRTVKLTIYRPAHNLTTTAHGEMRRHTVYNWKA